MAKQTFTTGQVLTAAQVNALQLNDYNQTVSAKVASYTLVAADAGTTITMSNASANTVTVNTSLFAAGDTLRITNIGAGVCTITAGTATVSTSGVLTLAQWASGVLYFSSTGVALWFGSAAAAGSGMTLLSTTTLSGAATITVSSISQSYKNLYVLITGVNVTTGAYTLKIRPNAVDLCNYSDISAGTVASVGATYISPGNAGHSASNVNNDIALTFYNYTDTVQNKPFIYAGLCKMTSQVALMPSNGLGGFVSASAITSISFNNDSGGNFVAGTVLVYGVS